MPLEQQNSLGQVSITPHVEAPNLAALAIALKQGLISNPEMDPFKEAAARTANLDTIQTLPIRRQQEIEANNQNAQLRGISIQGAQEQLKNLQDPLRPTMQNAEAQTVGTFVLLHPGVAIPRGQDGRPDLAMMNSLNIQAQNQAAARAENLKLQAKGQESLLQRYTDEKGSMPPVSANGTMDFSGLSPLLPKESKDALLKMPDIRAVENGLPRIEAALAALSKDMIPTGPFPGQAQVKGAQKTGAELEAAVGAIRNPMLALTRVPGIGVQSNLEARLAGLQFPSLNLPPESNAKNLADLKLFVQDLRTAYQNVLDGKVAPSAPVPAASAAPTSAAPVGPVEVKTQADYDAIPKGAQYRWNGQTLIKN